MKKLLALATLLVATTPTALASPYFHDVEDSAPYSSAVDYLYLTGLSTGDAGYYKPEETIQRGEFITMLCGLLPELSQLPDTPTFSDVKENHWALPYVETAYALGMANGKPDGSFGVEDPISLQDALTMLLNLFGDEIKTEVQNHGGYPNGYLSVAENYQLLTNIQSSATDYLLRKEVAYLLTNTFEPDPLDWLYASFGYWYPEEANQGQTSNLFFLNFDLTTEGYFGMSYGWFDSELGFRGVLRPEEIEKTGAFQFSAPFQSTSTAGGHTLGEIVTGNFDYTTTGMYYPTVGTKVTMNHTEYTYIGADYDTAYDNLWQIVHGGGLGTGVG